VRTRDTVTTRFDRELDWGALAPLRLRARSAAEGLWAGPHRSLRRGAGVEFAGYRAYTPGDDLRFLDRHALMRHGVRVVREFETDTDRSLRLVVDATASMSFRGSRAGGAKFAFAAVVAAALAWIALRGGDRVALDFLADHGEPLGWGSGMPTFERLVSVLEATRADGGVSPERLSNLAARLGRSSPGGSVTILFSDFLDLPPNALDELGALSGRRRTVVAVEVLDPDEIDLPFNGPVRLRALESNVVVDTDAPRARADYQAALAEHAARWREGFLMRGARFLRASTADEPGAVVRRVLEDISGAPA
jgi:uncharacterized protein (DUF58 family)